MTINIEKLGDIDIDGCSYGKLVQLRVSNLEKLSTETNAVIKEIIRTVDAKMNAVIIIGIVMSLFAGINIWQEILKLVLK